MSMLRRQVLRGAAVVAPLGWLGGCGFQLRGTQSYAFRSVLITGPSAAPSPLMLELQRSLLDAPGMRVHFDRAQAAQSDVRLDILQDVREKAAVGVGIAGQVREFELRMRVKFRLLGALEKELVDDTEIRQTQFITYNESAALAKEVEERQYYREMQSVIVGQILRRLAALQSL